MVSDYGRTRTNQKDQEITYSLHFARRFFTKICSYSWEDDDGLFPQQRALDIVHESLRVTPGYRKAHKKQDLRDFECPDWHSDCVTIVSNQALAIQLWDGMQSAVECYKCKDMVLAKGVGIGSTRKLTRALDRTMMKSIKQCWKDSGVRSDVDIAHQHMRETCTPLREVVWKRHIYRPGNHVVVLLDGSRDATQPTCWKAVILSIFMHKFDGCMQFFFEGSWYKNKWVRDTVIGEMVCK